MSDNPDPSDPASSGAVSWQPPSLEEMQDLLPQYEFISLIGHGGMGAVYKATQISLDRPVAVKVLPPGADDGEMGFTERFKVEARMMAKMNHPGIVSVHDFGIAGGHLLFIVMEFVDGTDVAKMIAAQTKLEPGHALAITAHVCDALRYAHERQVVHGDIKPANVLIGMDGQVKVADFGLARFNDAAQASGETGTGITLGTPDYVAPEVMTAGATVDGRADLYAVGVMLYNMLTGEVPRGIFQLPSVKIGCDPRMDAIICKAMEQDPARRYQTALEIRQDLDLIFAVPVAKAASTSRREPVLPMVPKAPPPQRGSWIWTVAVIAALGTLGFVVWRDHVASPATADTAKQSAEPVEGTRPEPKHDLEPRSGPVVTRLGPAEPGGKPVQQADARPRPASLPVETEATRHLAELDAQFQAALDRDVTQVRTTAIAALDAKYLAALDRSLAAASSSLVLTESQALQREKQRVESHGPLPDEDPGDLPATVKSLRDTYRTALDKIEAGVQPTAVSLHDKYGKVLAMYREELAKAGKGDYARRVTVKEKQVAASRVLALAGGPGHDIEYLTEAVKKEKGGTADGIVLKNTQKFETPDSFVPPVEITVVAKTENTNLRLGYAADQLIFNWEVREACLRVDGGPAGGKHKEGAGSIPKQTFVTVRWLVTPTLQTVFVNDEKRYEHSGAYSRIDRPVSVFTSNSTVTLKSLKVKPLRAPSVEKQASVQVEGAVRMPLRPGAKVYGDNHDHSWVTVPPLFGGNQFFQAAQMKEPVLKLKVLSDGLVYLACTSRWGGGGSGGDWRTELVTQTQLEAQGWRVVDSARELKTTEEDHTWLAFSRQCKAGESFKYRTEKYLSPIVIIDASGDATDGLPDDGGAITVDRVLPPGEYRNKKRLTIGRHDEVDPKKLYAVTVVSSPVTRIVDSSIAIEKGRWQAEGTRFIRTGLDLYLDGAMEAKNCIFEACTMGKKGTWFIPWFSTKWSLQNCIVTKSFLHGWNLTDVGVQARQCTFYGVQLPVIKYRDDAAVEVKKPWLTIKNCRFVECHVPESLLIATQDCVFEHCTFGDPEPKIPIKSPITLRIYTPEPGVKPATGPDRTVEVLDVAKVPSPAGTTLKHNRRQSIVDFVGPPGA